MNDLLRSFARALVGAFHPSMLFLTFVPFLVAAGLWGSLLYAFWQPLVDALRPALEHWWATAYLYHLFDLLGYGHEGTTYGCNFGVLFPWWDMMFGSAAFNREIEPTGIRDQLEGKSYGEGFWAQQGLAFRRIARRLAAQRRAKGATRDDASAA